MNVATYAAFKDELEKLSWHAGAEIAGLGLLAAPTAAKHFGGKEWSEKNKRRAELGGLGILAAPAAHSMYKAVKKGGMAAIKHASVDESLAGSALSLFKTAQGVGQVMGSFGAGTGKMIADTTRRAAAGGGVPLAQRVAERAAKMKMIAHKANPVKVLPSSGKTIHASINKEAFLKALLSKATPVAKQAFKPSFAGHAKALGTGASIAKSGVETVKSFNPLTQTMSKSKSISIPGLR